MSEENVIWVATTESTSTRGDVYIAPLKVEILEQNINVFLTQINSVLEKVPETVAKFQFVEFEISAEISAKGQVILLGSGGEAGVSGAIKFVFRKLLVPTTE